MKDIYTLALEDTKLSRKTHNEHSGPCPKCGGTDRFSVNFTKNNGKGGFMCRECWDPTGKGWGDAISYLRHVRKMSFHEAKAFLSDAVDNALDRVETAQKAYGEAPSLEWQEQARAFVNDAYERLRSREGAQARAYLYSRGLKDRMIDTAMLGYHPSYNAPLKDRTRRNIPVLVIPWYTGGQLWRVNMRNLHNPLPDEESKYYSYPGGVNSGLYNGDALDTKNYTMIVEGEFDALSIIQETNLVTPVATGTTTGSRTKHWIEKLSRVGHVFVSYDDEDKGEKASNYWLKQLPDSERYRPIVHDTNEMLKKGYNIEQWVLDAILQHRETVLRPYWCQIAEEEEKRLQREEANANAPVYVPVSLPDVPRLACPFQILTEVGRERYMKALPCKGKPLANGFCEEHQHSQLFLEMGAGLGYPRVEISESRVIGQGVENWEGHATRATLKGDLPRIKAILDMKQSA